MISIFISVVGFYFEFRILRQQLQKIGQNQLRIVLSQAVLSSSVVVSFKIFQNNSICVLIFHLTVLAILILSPPLLMKSFKKKIYSSILPVLDEIVLTMQSGKSFRAALKIVVDTQSGFLQTQLLEIYNQIALPTISIRKKHDYLDFLLTEFRDLDQTRVKSLEHLKSFRKHFSYSLESQRKEDEIKLSAKIQALLVSFLYACLAGYVLIRFGFLDHLLIILTSLFLFLLGQIAFYLVGLGRRWKV